MLRLRRCAQAVLAAVLLCIASGPACGQPDTDEYQHIQNLLSQKRDIDAHIVDLQNRIDEASAYSTYCSAEERQADLRNLRALQAEAYALRKQYADFKYGFQNLSITPGAGRALAQAGVHPDDRLFWAGDDSAVQKLRDSALKKADQVDNARIVNCEGPKTTEPKSPPVTETPPATTPPPSSPPAPPVKKPPSATPQEQPGLGPNVPLGPRPGCTDKERHDAILRLQEELLRLQQELIPIDGTTPKGRARQLELIKEIDRLKKLMELDCPPLLPPLQQPPPPPKQAVPTPPRVGRNVGGTQRESYAGGPSPREVAEAKDAKQEYDAITAGVGGLGFAFYYAGERNGCDLQQMQAYIAKLEEFKARARALAEASKEAGAYSSLDPARAQQLADHIQRHIDEARQVSTVDCPAGVRFKMSPWDGKILAIINRDRAAVGVQPLHWDPVLAAHADSYAQQLARLGQLVHAAREGRGIERENLGQGRAGETPDRIVEREWSSEQRYFRAGYFPNICEGDWTKCSHHSQDIWPTTTDIGCGYANGGGFVWVDCRFSPGGNKDNQPVGYRDPSTYRGGPLVFDPRYLPELRRMQTVNPDKLEFGDEAVAEWRNFENARARCNAAGMTAAIDKLKYYAQAAHEHSAEEHMKGNEPASGIYDSMARQIDDRVGDASLYRDACARNPYAYQERG